MDSPAIQLLKLVWQTSKTPTRSKLSQVMNEALKLVISSGMRFDVEDFEDDVANHYADEYHYSLAVRTNNLSAARAWEAYRKRKPFFTNNVQYNSLQRARGRLIIGAEFFWEGRKVEVTSFALNGDSLIATLSMSAENAEVLNRLKGKVARYSVRVVKRYRITREMLKEVKNGMS